MITRNVALLQKEHIVSFIARLWPRTCWMYRFVIIDCDVYSVVRIDVREESRILLFYLPGHFFSCCFLLFLSPLIEIVCECISLITL